MVRKLSKTLALVLCAVLCLGLCIPALAADYPSDTNGGGITATVTATPDSLAAGADGSVTVTVVFSEAIQCSGFNANVSVPSGWSTTANDVKVNLSNDAAQKTGYNATQNTIAKALSNEYGTNGDEYALVTGFSITYTVTGAAAGEQTVGLTNLEVKKVGLDTAYQWETATVAVTVTGAAPVTASYSLGALSLHGKDGESLAAIPAKDFLVTVPVTKTAGEGDCLVFLAAYGESGQFRGLLYVQLEDVPEGATVKVTLPVKNTDGSIASLKAFCVASFGNLTPLGEAAAFPAE